jgi:hypothetical protein
MYKGNLMDIKYYQNEMTNIEFKFLSLRAAISSNDEGLLKDVLCSMYSDDRNSRQQASNPIEKAKADPQFDKQLFEGFKIFMETFQKAK